MRSHFEFDSQRDFLNVRGRTGKFNIHYNLWGEEEPKYRVSIKSLADYKHLLQEKYVEYKQ